MWIRRRNWGIRELICKAKRKKQQQTCHIKIYFAWTLSAVLLIFFTHIHTRRYESMRFLFICSFFHDNLDYKLSLFCILLFIFRTILFIGFSFCTISICRFLSLCLPFFLSYSCFFTLKNDKNLFARTFLHFWNISYVRVHFTFDYGIFATFFSISLYFCWKLRLQHVKNGWFNIWKQDFQVGPQNHIENECVGKVERKRIYSMHVYVCLWPEITKMMMCVRCSLNTVQALQWLPSVCN